MRASSSYAAHATHVQAHVCYMNWYDRYLHRKLCAHVRKKVSKQVITSQTRTFSDHAIMSHSADQNPWDFKMNGCRLKIWPLLRGTSRCPCRPCIDGTQLCNKPLQNANANCLHMDMGMPWVHGALRVGHIETRLTSITLLFLLVFCWFPWTDCRITWSILIYLYYFIQKCPTLSRSLWKRQAEQQISHLRRRQCLVRYEDLKINGEWERLKLWFHINMSDRRIGRDMSKTFKDAVCDIDIIFYCISCQCDHLLAMQRTQRMYERMHNMDYIIWSPKKNKNKNTSQMLMLT